MKPFKCSFLGNDLIAEDLPALQSGREGQSQRCPKCLLWMFLSRVPVLESSQVLLDSFCGSSHKGKGGGKGLSVVLRSPKAGLEEGEGGRQLHWIRPHPSSPCSVRNGTQGWPGICHCVGHLLLTPSQPPRVALGFFSPLVCSEGKKFTFCRFLCSSPLFTKRILEPYQFFKETRQEGFEFCTVVGLKGQQHDAF